MSVLYRSLFETKPSDLVGFLALARELFTSWATDSATQTELCDGVTVVTLRRSHQVDGREQSCNVDRSVSLRSLSGSDNHYGFEGTTRETVGDMTWTTIVRIITADRTVHVWVENQVESERLVGIRPTIGRPRIVEELLRVSPDAHLGGSMMRTEPVSVSAGEISVLVEHLRSETRTLPVIVASQPKSDEGEAWKYRARQIARRTSGVAVVVTVDRDAATSFSNELGKLATWDGSIRVYAPVPVVNGEGHRHRYTLRALLEDPSTERSHIDRIVHGVCSLSARRRPASVFNLFLPTTKEPTDLSAYLSPEEAEVFERDWQSKLASANADASGAIEEQEQLSRELSLKIGHLDRLHRALEERKIFDLFYETQHDPGSGIPDEVDDMEMAVLCAMDYLSDWVVIHEDATRALDGINTAPQAAAWGNTAWRGFRALAAFASARNDGFSGSFYDWCRSDPAMGWPATSKKLSMTESDTVKNNSALSSKRVLPISVEVDPTGRKLMLAHLKIAEGGGNLAPRVYFYDDTAGATRKVHVGFIGPHHLMPNTRS